MQSYKLKEVNGVVTFLRRTGKNFVKGKMKIADASHIINSAQLKESSISGFPINADDIYYFEGTQIKKRKIAEVASDENVLL